MKEIPIDILETFRVALLGEIYPSIRAIALRYDFEKLLLRYYLDRNPIDFDYESIEVVAINFDASLSRTLIKSIDVECVFSKKPIRDLDPLDCFLYARREYDL